MENELDSAILRLPHRLEPGIESHAGASGCNAGANADAFKMRRNHHHLADVRWHATLLPGCCCHFLNTKKKNKKRRGSSKMEGEKNVPAPRSMIFLCLPLAFILLFFFFFKNFKVSSSSCLSIQQNCSHCPTASSTSFQISGGDVIFRPCQLIEWERRRLSFYTLWKSLKIGKSAREILFTINFRNMSG